jgi:hypothetical protein
MDRIETKIDHRVEAAQVTMLAQTSRQKAKRPDQ